MIPVLLTVPYLFEMLAFLAGYTLIKKDWPFQFRQLVWMLGLTLLVELTGTILRSRAIHTGWLYIFSPVQCFSFLFVFYRESVRRVIRKLNKFLLWAVLPLVVLTWLIPQTRFLHPQLEFMAMLFLQLIGACAIYIDLLLRKEKGSFFRQPLFWLAGGIILFCFLHVLIFSLTHYLLSKQDYRSYYWSALGNLFLYGGIAMCFFRLDRTRVVVAVVA